MGIKIATVWSRGIDGNERLFYYIAPIDESELNQNQWVEYRDIAQEKIEMWEWDFQFNAQQILLIA